MSRVGAIFGVDVLATLFCVFGWLSGPGYDSDPRDRAHFEPNGRTSVVTAVVIWGYSIAVTIVIAIVYFLMNRISWLDNLGRKSRSRSDTNVENIIASLVCLTLTLALTCMQKYAYKNCRARLPFNMKPMQRLDINDTSLHRKPRMPKWMSSPSCFCI